MPREMCLIMCSTGTIHRLCETACTGPIHLGRQSRSLSMLLEPKPIWQRTVIVLLSG